MDIDKSDDGPMCENSKHNSPSPSRNKRKRDADGYVTKELFELNDAQLKVRLLHLQNQKNAYQKVLRSDPTNKPAEELVTEHDKKIQDTEKILNSRKPLACN